METRAIIAKVTGCIYKYEKPKINSKRKTDKQQTNETLLNVEICAQECFVSDYNR